MIPRSLHPITSRLEAFILRWALRDLPPTHKAVPAILLRLHAGAAAPSPLDPADTIVTGACILALLALLAMAVVGWL